MADGDMIGIVSATLETISVGERPETACATCPKAMWYRTSSRLRAFCRELRHITWHDGEEPVIQCDGREAALALTDTADA